MTRSHLARARKAKKEEEEEEKEKKKAQKKCRPHDDDNSAKLLAWDKKNNGGRKKRGEGKKINKRKQQKYKSNFTRGSNPLEPLHEGTCFFPRAIMKFSWTRFLDVYVVGGLRFEVPDSFILPSCGCFQR